MNNDYLIKYIKTKNKVRKIVIYNNVELKDEHTFIKKYIESNYSPSIFSKGYVIGESIYTNALAHMYNDFFIKLDIKDFFNSINHNLLKKKIYKELSYIISPKDCDILVNMCSVSNKGLPLGLVTSPLLSNIFLKDFDLKLYKRLKKIHCDNLIYTRYADDMIISFKRISFINSSDYVNLKMIVNDIIMCVKDLLSDYHLKLNDKKIRFIDFNKTKQVRITGVYIIEKNGLRRLSIGRNQKRKLFYDAINYKKSNCEDGLIKNKMKGLLSFYLSIEKVGFEDFLSLNMRKELEEYNCNSFVEFMSKL